MNRVIVTYETQHGGARKIAEIIGEKLKSKVINVDTPFEAEDLTRLNTIVMVFNFRGPYTAQLTKLYLERVKKQMGQKNLILVGEGIFSEKEFPVVAGEIAEAVRPREFYKFFVPGQLRMEVLYPEERALLKKFGELTGMEIRDMGELDLDRARKVAEEIADIVKKENEKMEKENIKKVAEVAAAKTIEEEKQENKWVCGLCGYVHNGDNPPEKCPLCGAPASVFKKS